MYVSASFDQSSAYRTKLYFIQIVYTHMLGGKKALKEDFRGLILTNSLSMLSHTNYRAILCQLKLISCFVL